MIFFQRRVLLRRSTFKMTELPRLKRIYANLTTTEACNKELKQLEAEKERIEEDYADLEEIVTSGTLMGYSHELDEIWGRMMFVESIKKGIEGTAN